MRLKLYSILFIRFYCLVRIFEYSFKRHFYDCPGFELLVCYRNSRKCLAVSLIYKSFKIKGLNNGSQEKLLTFNPNIMSDTLYIISIVMIVLWLLGYFVFSLGAIIHFLLVIALISILLRLVKGKRNT